jgi:hypothetical protein
MQASRITSSASPAHRFLLLPEDSLQAGSRRPRIRRYQLTVLSPRGEGSAGHAAAARGRVGEAPARV